MQACSKRARLESSESDGSPQKEKTTSAVSSNKV